MKRVVCNPRDRITKILWIRVKRYVILGVLIRKRFQLINLELVVICLKKKINII